MSVKELSRKSGYTEAVIAGLEKGRVRWETLRDVSATLRVTTSGMLGLAEQLRENYERREVLRMSIRRTVEEGVANLETSAP